MNIVSMAAQYLTPMIVEKIASSLGITNPMAQKAIAAIIPTILAGLIGTSSKPEGLGALTKALGQQDPGLLGNLGGMIGGAGQSGMVSAGTDILGSLLGNAGVGAMTNAVAKFAGVGEAPTKGLIGMLAPVVLGSVAKEQKSSNLDAAGLAKMLMGQKDNVTAAMPAGFSDLLKGSGLLDQLSPAAPKAAAAAPSRPVEAPRAASAPSSASWMPWVAALALAALAGWYFLGAGAPKTAFPMVPKITVGSQDVGAQLGSVVEGLRGTLTGIKDEGSARTALPRLQDMSKQIEALGVVRNQLPAEGKKGMATYLAAILPLIRPMIDKALAGSGVAPIAKPVLDQIFARLEAMSKA